MSKKEKPLPRNEGKRKTEKSRKQIVLIVCEGGATAEKPYLEAWKQKLRLGRTVLLEICTDQGQHRKLVENARQKQKELAKKNGINREEVELWCVFDSEGERDSEQFKEACGSPLFKAKNAYACVSRPSIEYWFLLHYENSGQLYENSDQVVKQLQKHCKNWEKKQRLAEKRCTELQEKWQEGAQRAKERREQYEKDGETHPYRPPYTDMDKLVSRLHELADN